MLLPLIKEGNMEIHIFIHIMEDHIIFYGNCAVKTIDFLGIAEKKKESFFNRIDAMYRWFRSIYAETY